MQQVTINVELLHDNFFHRDIFKMLPLYPWDQGVKLVKCFVSCLKWKRACSLGVWLQ